MMPELDTADKPAYRLSGRVGGVNVTYPLSTGLNRVGSGASNDLVLDQAGVSREHALLVVEAGRIEVVDQKSKNGTFVKGRRIRRRRLTAGDSVVFGPLRMCLESTDPDDARLALELTPMPSDEGPYTADPATGTMAGTRDGAESSAPTDCGLTFPAGHVVGRSAAACDLYRQMAQIAPGDLPVLLVGETGVGKEFAARILHDSSPRRSGPLVTINCAAVPSQLLEAELFGIGERVATGVAARRGRFREAHGGTLCLDEIGEMEPALQSKLLRVLQERRVEPLGAPAEDLDVRLLASTNADIQGLIRDGRFRQDLYFRLAGYVLELPPLRERRDDIPAFVESLIRRESRALDKPIRGVTIQAMRRLEEYSWPGNVRELEHQVRRMVCQCPQFGLITESLVSLDWGRGEAGVASAVPSGLEPGSAPDWQSRSDLTLETIESEVVGEALRRTDGNQVQAARLLGISRYKLRRRMAHFGLGDVETS